MLWDNFLRHWIGENQSRKQSERGKQVGGTTWVGKGESGKEVKVGYGISEQRIDYGKG